MTDLSQQGHSTHAWAKIKSGWGKLPIVGHLAHCSRKNHADTAREFFSTLIFSTATFWLTALILLGFNQYSHGGQSALSATMNSGQLFIFSVGMLGPILFVALDEPANAKSFPGRVSHVLVLVLIGFISVGLYALEVSARIPILAGVLDKDFLFHASIWVSLIVLSLRYLTTLYRKSTLSFDPELQLKGPVDSFAQQFAAKHAGGAP